MSTIYDSNQILALAFEQGPKQLLTTALRDAFNVSYETVCKWASINDCSKRRNPLGACLKLYQVLWFHYRPAAFQIKAAFTEMEYLMQPQDQPPFDALDLLDDLRKATRLVETIQSQQLRAGQNDPSRYRDALAEIAALASIHTDRMIVTQATPSAPITRRYNAATPKAYERIR